MVDDMGMRIRLSLDNLIVSERLAGRNFGARVRRELGKPQIPEPLVEGSTKMSEDSKGEAFRVWSISEMWRLGLTIPALEVYARRKAISLSDFFGRGQEDINPWVR